MGIVWISSYPKSGNTWLRFLLTNYLVGPVGASQQVEQFVPGFSKETDGHALVRERGVVFGKTHYMWGPAHPSAELTDRAIVVVRHPKDVLLSNLNFFHLACGSDVGFSDDMYARTFITHGGDPRWKAEGYGTLEQHSASWVEGMDAARRLILRYEDLKADCTREFDKVIHFLNLPRDEERLRSAVARSNFDTMRAMETREKLESRNGIVFPGPPPRRGWARYFMNSGRVRGSLKHLSPGLDEAFNTRFAALMARHGYTATPSK